MCLCVFTVGFFFFCRTLSNWTYEFDKWAPSVVKISYKVWSFVFIYKCGKAKNWAPFSSFHMHICELYLVVKFCHVHHVLNSES